MDFTNRISQIEFHRLDFTNLISENFLVASLIFVIMKLFICTASVKLFTKKYYNFPPKITEFRSFIPVL